MYSRIFEWQVAGLLIVIFVGGIVSMAEVIESGKSQCGRDGNLVSVTIGTEDVRYEKVTSTGVETLRFYGPREQSQKCEARLVILADGTAVQTHCFRGEHAGRSTYNTIDEIPAGQRQQLTKLRKLAESCQAQ